MRWNDPDRNTVVTAMWRSGKTQSDIGHTYGVSSNSVAGLVSRLDLPSRVPGYRRGTGQRGFQPRPDLPRIHPHMRKPALSPLADEFTPPTLKAGPSGSAVRREKKKPAVKVAPPRQARAQPRPLAPPLPSPAQVGRVEGFSDGCQFPLSHGRPWLFCDQPHAAGRAYCAYHQLICFARTAGLSDMED